MSPPPPTSSPLPDPPRPDVSGSADPRQLPSEPDDPLAGQTVLPEPPPDPADADER